MIKQLFHTQEPRIQTPVTGQVDRNNQVVVRNQYDSWGKVTASEDTSSVSLATLNPFRYRRYIYDPDVIFARLQELYHKNLYAYCDNNPVVKEDQSGSFQIPCIVGALVGAVVSGFSYVLSSEVRLMVSNWQNPVSC